MSAQAFADLRWGMGVRKQELDRCKTSLRRSLKTVEKRHLVEQQREIGGKVGHRSSSRSVYFGSPGNFVPVTRAYIRATDASSSRPMPAAAVMRNICKAAAATGTGNFADRAMSWMMPRSLTKISTALFGV